ncbi:endoplasmic reticulum membrane-associated RNA degradation protein-like isoform X2 [Mya arenaria]|uniref:endoplasmic reticulum membrane-associated RNA degradation protein-like isoform X2 n=1 Tax=Mya arenaria TaxID=6604 RepID=UPI0022E3092F|nr:endoplasmic reticulum membrane-associated RNA degradation protein-like isoform X2 [Mya arenaria]
MDGISLTLPVVETCLSSYVNNLITKLAFTEACDDNALNEGFLDFKYICSMLSGNAEDEPSVYFPACVTSLAPILTSVENLVGKIGPQNFLDTYLPYVSWTGKQQVLAEIWRDMFTHNPVNEVTALLVSSAVLERALGDVYMLKGPAPCPSMLKDLLVTEQLKEILGEHVMCILRLVMGPPTSLNLRNVAWHGFPFPGEIPARCIWFLILLVPSIGRVLEERLVPVLMLHREPVVFPRTKLITEVDILSSKDLIEAVKDTQFSSWDTRMFWTNITSLYTQERYGECTALLLYYLEQGLRLVFATANNCENRILTAEATTLYTTFDEMLDPFLPDGSENRLRMVIGEEILEIILDHLTYPGGPRVRDRLSHGEACWERFPWQLTRNLATICVALSAMFVKDGKHIHNKCVTILHEDIKSYSVQFHRISLLKKEISTFFKKASETDSMILLQPDLSERKPNDPFQSTDEASSLEAKLRDIVAVFDGHWAYVGSKCFQYCDLHHLKSTVDEILQQKIHTLYRNSKGSNCDIENEVLTLLDHIVDECLQVITQMQQFATNRQQQMTLKQLRSRQRENFKKFLASVPSLVVGPCTCVYMCCCQLYQLDEIKAREGPQSNNKLIKFWKSVLKLCENLRTFTHHDKNKWTEGEDPAGTIFQSADCFPVFDTPRPFLSTTTSAVCQYISRSSNAEDEPSLYFPACVTSLAPILTSVENHVEDIGPQNFLDTYLPYVSWTGKQQMLDTFLLNGTENRHRMVMGEDILEILLDHLTYPAGPRVRDRFSHEQSCNSTSWGY